MYMTTIKPQTKPLTQNLELYTNNPELNSHTLSLSISLSLFLSLSLSLR